MTSIVCGVDAQRRIVDASVIVLRPVEHHGAALEGVGIVGIGQIARAEFAARSRWSS